MLRNAVQCPVLEVPWDTAVLETVRVYLQIP